MSRNPRNTEKTSDQVRQSAEKNAEAKVAKVAGVEADKEIVMQDEATYICDACGEEIVIPLDLSAGESQEYVEDCPVCCRANTIHVEIDEKWTGNDLGRSGIG